VIAVRAEKVPEGSILLDTDTPVTDAALDAAWEYGATGIIRYVGFGKTRGPLDISPAERDLIVTPKRSRRFGLLLVQHVRFDPWMPSEEMGHDDGEAALIHLAEVEYAPGSTFWDDLEGIAEGDTSEPTVDYANAKCQMILGGGFEQGEYIGDRVPLASAALYHELLADLYWKSASEVPDVLVRSYCMVQGSGVTLAGIRFDRNKMTGDRLGGRPTWTVAA